MEAITLKNGELLVDKQVQSVMSVSKISAKQIRDYIDSRTPQPLIMKKKSLFGKSVVFWENSPAGRAKPFPFMLLSGVQSLSIFIFQHGVTPYCTIQSFKFCLFLVSRVTPYCKIQSFKFCLFLYFILFYPETHHYYHHSG